jgi:hypothetical protein
MLVVKRKYIILTLSQEVKSYMPSGFRVIVLLKVVAKAFGLEPINLLTDELLSNSFFLDQSNVSAVISPKQGSSTNSEQCFQPT